MARPLGFRNSGEWEYQWPSPGIFDVKFFLNLVLSIENSFLAVFSFIYSTTAVPSVITIIPPSVEDSEMKISSFYNLPKDVKYYFTVFILIGVANSCFTFARAFLFAYGGIRGAYKIHALLLQSILKVCQKKIKNLKGDILSMQYKQYA